MALSETAKCTDLLLPSKEKEGENGREKWKSKISKTKGRPAVSLL